MSLKQELKELRQKKRMELRTLHETYVATKHDVKRQLAPERIVRRHTGISLAAAAVLGLLLAPRPGSRGMVNGEKPATGGFFSGGILRLIGRIFRFTLQLIGHFISPSRQLGAAAPDETPAASASPRPTGLVQSAVEMVLRHVDFSQLAMDLIGLFGAKSRKNAAVSGENGNATVSSSDNVPLRQEPSEEQ